jgi:hypothetical protein
MQSAPVIPCWLPPPATIPADAAGPPRFRHDPFARDMASDPGGAMAPRDRGTTHFALGAHDGLGLHNVVISWLNPIPHAITVYASDPASPRRPHTRYRAARYALPGRDLHPLDHASLPGAPCADPYRERLSLNVHAPLIDSGSVVSSMCPRQLSRRSKRLSSSVAQMTARNWESCSDERHAAPHRDRSIEILGSREAQAGY